MEELTMLDFDLDFAPDIYADILCAEIIDLDEKRVFEYSGCREFVITLSDNTVSEIYFNELFHRRATYPAYTFTSIKDKHRYIFFPKKGGKLLRIKSNIYALQESKKSPSELNRSYLPLNIKIDVMSPTDYEQYFPSIKDVIIDIAKAIESSNSINEILRRQVENIIMAHCKMNLQ